MTQGSNHVAINVRRLNYVNTKSSKISHMNTVFTIIGTKVDSDEMLSKNINITRKSVKYFDDTIL